MDEGREELAISAVTSTPTYLERNVLDADRVAEVLESQLGEWWAVEAWWSAAQE